MKCSSLAEHSNHFSNYNMTILSCLHFSVWLIHLDYGQNHGNRQNAWCRENGSRDWSGSQNGGDRVQNGGGELLCPMCQAAKELQAWRVKENGLFRIRGRWKTFSKKGDMLGRVHDHQSMKGKPRKILWESIPSY